LSVIDEFLRAADGGYEVKRPAGAQLHRALALDMDWVGHIKDRQSSASLERPSPLRSRWQQLPLLLAEDTWITDP
jgi:hypothetical protein